MIIIKPGKQQSNKITQYVALSNVSGVKKSAQSEPLALPDFHFSGKFHALLTTKNMLSSKKSINRIPLDISIK